MCLVKTNGIIILAACTLFYNSNCQDKFLSSTSQFIVSCFTVFCLKSCIEETVPFVRLANIKLNIVIFLNIRLIFISEISLLRQPRRIFYLTGVCLRYLGFVTFLTLQWYFVVLWWWCSNLRWFVPVLAST